MSLSILALPIYTRREYCGRRTVLRIQMMTMVWPLREKTLMTKGLLLMKLKLYPPCLYDDHQQQEYHLL
jgi:hypothetical protein